MTVASLMSRATFAAMISSALLGVSARPTRNVHIVTYRDEGCSCCEGWVHAARAAGYSVELHDLTRTARLSRFKLGDAIASCHTSLIGGYVVEGHVPLELVAKLLDERPHIRGIAAPGMPTGVAGMDGPRMGTLDIVTIEAQPRVYARV